MAETDREEAEARPTFTITSNSKSKSDPSPDHGLEIRVQCESEAANESYRVRVFALVPDDSAEGLKEVQLGGQDIFKPLSKGETTSIFIDGVDEAAWTEADSGLEMKLGLEIEPANPGRDTPDVSLRIIEATPES